MPFTVKAGCIVVWTVWYFSQPTHPIDSMCDMSQDSTCHSILHGGSHHLHLHVRPGFASMFFLKWASAGPKRPWQACIRGKGSTPHPWQIMACTHSTPRFTARMGHYQTLHSGRHHSGKVLDVMEGETWAFNSVACLVFWSSPSALQEDHAAAGRHVAQ